MHSLRVRLLLSLFMLCEVAVGIALADQLPAPVYPLVSYYNKDTGTVTLAVSFGRDGSVTKCEIEKSSTSKGLAESTRFPPTFR